jgi:hypothetical protein
VHDALLLEWRAGDAKPPMQDIGENVPLWKKNNYMESGIRKASRIGQKYQAVLPM